MKKLVYIASPYTLGDPVLNVRTQIDAAEKVTELGFLPYIPLLNHLWHIASPHDYQYWIDAGIEWVRHCDILLRLPGDSKGADAEVQLAAELGIPVIYGLHNFRMYVQFDIIKIEVKFPPASEG